MPLASTETAIASTVNFDRYSSIPTEKPAIPVATPTPTTDDLCAQAVREVEASRKLIEVQQATIELLTKQNLAYAEKDRAQSELLNVYRQQNDRAIAMFDNYERQLKNRDEQITNRDKEIELLKKKKPSMFARLADIMIGVGIGLLFK
jgi:replicative DNA helicase